MVAKVKNRITIGAILIILLLSASVFILGFKLTINKTPKEVYVVYVDGQKIGIVKSAKEFEEYINYQEEKLKDKYKVSKIHTPKGVEIKKEITYKDKFDSYDTIYNMLVKKQNFTIKGVIVTMEKEMEQKEESEK